MEEISKTNKRLKELYAKGSLTDEEMKELISLSSPGSAYELPNIMSLGVKDVLKFINNSRHANDMIKRAMSNGCYIEALSLRLQFIDLWLRTFLVAKNKNGKIFEIDDKRTFGMLINECKNLGFDDTLLKKLEAFNKNRIEAIHKYLLGVTDYSTLKNVCDDSQTLSLDVSKYVGFEIGIPLN